MKKCTVLLLSFLTFSICGQDADVLDTTWYLRYLQIEGEREYAPISDGFTLDINEFSGDFDFEAFASSNGLLADVVFDDVNASLSLSNLGITLVDCAEYCDYEDLYFFSFLTDIDITPKDFHYQVNSYSEGKKSLMLIDDNNNRAYYINELISVNENLFGTWYIFQQDVDLGESSYYDPSADYSLTINEDFTFSGTDGCVLYDGNFRYGEEFVTGFLLDMESYVRNPENCENGNDTGTRFLEFAEEQSFRTDLYQQNEEDILTLEGSPGFTMYFTKSLLSISDTSQPLAHIFPNPASDFIEIETDNETLIKIQIFTLKGEEVSRVKRITPDRLNVQGLPSGVYFIRIETRTGAVVKKIIKS